MLVDDVPPEDDPDNEFLRRLEAKLLDAVTLQGIKNVRKVFMRQEKRIYVDNNDPDGGYAQAEVPLSLSLSSTDVVV